jgi:K+-transporting ATPase ATPase C chain
MMSATLRSCVILFATLSLITGVIYPLAVWIVAQTVFPQRANGSVISCDGQVIGSELIGRSFDEPHYFWGRPSATDPAYNAASSTGSNLGPTNQKLLDALRDRVATIRAAHPDQADQLVPVDLVTASASGLDPHISPAAAEFQVLRVAKARAMSQEQVRQLVAAHTEGRTLGLLGEPHVNVLRLNLALDQQDDAR